MACQLCHQGQEAEDICGTLHVVANSKCCCMAHQRCMQYSSNLTQYRLESFGGFIIDDVEKEIQRGKKLRCMLCKKTGATAGCSYEKCNKTYHFPCASKSHDVFVKQSEKNSSQDTNQLVSLFLIFCGCSHMNVYMSNLNMVAVSVGDGLPLDGINKNVEDETANDSVESSGSISLPQCPYQSVGEMNLRGFGLLAPDANEDAVDINPALVSGSCIGNTDAFTDDLSAAFLIDENSIDSDLVLTSAIGENVAGLGLATSVQQTAAQTSCNPVSAAESNCIVTSADASSASCAMTSTIATDTVPSAVVATRPVSSPAETADTVTSSSVCVTEDVIVTNLSQSQSCSRRDRLCLRSSQKRRRERQADEELANCEGSSRAAEAVDVSLPLPAEPDEITNLPMTRIVEEMDLDSLPDPFAESPKKKSYGCHDPISTPPFKKASRQNVSTSKARLNNSRLDRSQRLITSMLSRSKDAQDFENEAIFPFEGQKEKSPATEGFDISNTSEEFQTNCPIDDVGPSVLLNGQSVSLGAEVHDLYPTVLVDKLDYIQETLDVNVKRTAQRVLMTDGNGETADSPAEDDDSCNASFHDMNSNSKEAFDFIWEEDANKECDDDGDGYDDCDDAFEVMSSNFSESSSFTLHQEKLLEVDQVCALCIPVSEEPLDKKTVCVLLKYAICKLGLVEENTFSWQMTGCKKIQILKAVLQCSECLRDQNGKKLMERLFKNGQFDAMEENSQDGDSSSEESVEAILLTIHENFNIAKRKYGVFMGELFTAPNSNIQAAFIILNELNDVAFTARSYLPRSRVHSCNEDTKFASPFNLSDAQTKMVSNLEYKNLIWCLENWFDHSTILVYPTDCELRKKNISPLSRRIGSYFTQRMLRGGNAYFVFLYRTDPDLMNYRLFVCKMLAFVKEELVTLNHDACVVFDVGGETGIASLSDVVTPTLAEISAGCCMEVQAYAGVNPKYSPVSCLLIHLSLQDQKGF